METNGSPEGLIEQLDRPLHNATIDEETGRDEMYFERDKMWIEMVNEWKEKCLKYETTLSELQKTLIITQKKLSEAKKCQNTLEQQLAQRSQEERPIVLEKLNPSEDSIDNLSEIQSMRKELEDNKDKYNLLLDQLSRKEDDLQKLTQQLEEAKFELELSNLDNNRLVKELESSVGNNMSSEDTRERNNDNTDGITVNDSEGDDNSKFHQFEKLQMENDRLKEKIEYLLSDSNFDQSISEEENQSIISFQSQITHLTGQNSELIRKIENLNDIVLKERHMKNEIEEAWIEDKKQIEALRNELKSREDEHNEVMQQFEDERLQVEVDTVNCLKEQIKELRKVYDDAAGT